MGCCSSSESDSPTVYVEPAPPPLGFNVPPPNYNPPPHHHHQHHHQSGDSTGYKWVNSSAGCSLPHTAVTGGRDCDGSEIFVGRAYHEGDMLPAKVIPQKSVAYVCHGGQEHPKRNFEVLCRGEFQWEFCSHGSIPPDAVVAGQTSSGEPLYVGRTLHNGAQTVGKVQQSHGCLYIPFDGQELSFKDYEVLVMH